VEDTIADAIAALIDADIDAEHRRQLAYAVVGLAEGTGRYWLRGNRADRPEVLAGRMADLTWAGLRGVHR
jgi:hypothetical protein